MTARISGKLSFIYIAFPQTAIYFMYVIYKIESALYQTKFLNDTEFLWKQFPK